MKTVAAVLAAGASRRLGRPKQLIDYRGRPLIVHATRLALAAGCDRTVVVWGASPVDAVLDGLPVELVENPEWQEGMSSSVRAAVRAAGHSRLLITLVDQPLVTADHLRRLVGSRAAICATGYGGSAGVPALFDPTLFDELLRLRGDRGARALIEAHGAEVIPFEEAGLDIDREEDIGRSGL